MLKSQTSNCSSMNKSSKKEKLPYYDTAIKKFIEEEGEVVKIKNRLKVVTSKHQKMIHLMNRIQENQEKS